MNGDNREKERRPQDRGGGPMGPGMMRSGEKAKDFRGTLKKLVQYMKKYQILILVVFCFAAAGAVFSIVGPKILGGVTTEVFEGIMGKITGTGEGVNFDSVARTMLILLGLYVLSAL
ncbi:MAG TPA: ABC transporter ATP-binding protein, partial [Mesotoga sp.]|nr:ABC transporter ATP-binding protein [Mesotoga sp.]